MLAALLAAHLALSPRSAITDGATAELVTLSARDLHRPYHAVFLIESDGTIVGQRLRPDGTRICGYAGHADTNGCVTLAGCQQRARRRC